ncbi:MAG: ATP-dependent RecD-like DNA helicase [Acutalibacteraceae bacterium]|nr:ATP-dependent RecD-like DNA helicase [Acutalibacteraceae bacterium]
MDELITITGTVEYITYRNTENGYTVLDFSSDGELFTATGNVGELYNGEKVSFTGRWMVHPTFGKQFKFEMCRREMPQTAADMLSYLSSGIVKGVKEKTAQKIVERFGEDTFYIIENHPERLAEIKGISKERAREISSEFRRRAAEREALISLEKYGITTAECLKVFKVFGSRSVETVERNPYLLCSEGVGITFEKACSIASRLPVPPADECRIDAGILYVVKHNLYNGHTCLPREKLIPPCCDLLDANADTVDIRIDYLIETRQLVSDNLSSKDFIFLPDIYNAEKNAANSILFMKRFAPKCLDNIDEQIDKSELISGVCYNERQRLAIRLAVEKGILVLTGGPGTGKTTTLRGILKVFENQGLEVALAAPTGRAAKRMSELTGREAKTIHRLLEVEWDNSDRPVFQRNKRNPLSVGAVIIDELSMVDIVLFSSLLDALPIGCRLVMVGDSDQLPPVGAGNVLHDIINSKALPVVELKDVFRQAMESLIVTNAHKIVNGELPEISRTDKDFFFLERTSPFVTAKTVAELCAERLPKAYGYSPTDDIQVLCPSRKGDAGTVHINKILQAALNPPAKHKHEHSFGQCTLREGDKLMQVKNNYNIPWTSGEKDGLGVFNGDIGMLEKIDEGAHLLYVRYDDRLAEYPFESRTELEHAYAVTVHKSQGNEFDAVVMPVAGVVEQLAYRNLLYTAVTRAKKMMVLVGTRSTVEKMVANNSKAKRYSALKNFIMLGDG